MNFNGFSQFFGLLVFDTDFPFFLKIEITSRYGDNGCNKEAPKSYACVQSVHQVPSK